MQFPDRVRDILTRYAVRFPVPTGEPGDAHEERVRNWTICFAQQVAWEIGPAWGMKRADPNRPISKDTLTQRRDGGTLWCWDLLIGTGTGQPRVAADPAWHDVTGQTFVPVEPRNHLAEAGPAPAPPDPLPLPPPTGTDLDTVAILDALRRTTADLSQVLDRLATLEEQQRALLTELRLTKAVVVDLHNRPVPPVPFPRYVGRLWGVSVVLSPEGK